MPYVYSTMSSDVTYHQYNDHKDVPAPKKSILINGGSGMASKNLITPQGVVTQVSSEDLEILKADEVFRTHEKNGFIRYTEKSADPEKVSSADMTLRDESAPIVPEDFSDDAAAKPQKAGIGGKKGTSQPLE